MADTEGTTEQTSTTTGADTVTEQVDQSNTEESSTQETDPKAEAEKWKALARKHEAQAKTNADKARRFEEFEESQKTEIQKATDRAEAAERKAAEVEARAIRAEVSAAKGVPGELLTGSTVEELEASAEKLLKFANARKTAGKSGADFSGGTGEMQGIDAQIAAAEKAGDHAKAISLKRQKAYNH